MLTESDIQARENAYYQRIDEEIRKQISPGNFFQPFDLLAGNAYRTTKSFDDLFLTTSSPEKTDKDKKEESKKDSALSELELSDEDKKAITDIFTQKASPEYEAAQQGSKDFQKTMSDWLEKKPLQPQVSGMISSIKEKLDAQRKAIQARHSSEYKQFEDKLKDLGTSAESKFHDPKVQKEMLGKLKSEHDAQLKAFEEQAASNLTKLHNAAATEVRRLLFLNELQKVKKMQPEFADALNKKQGGDTYAVIQNDNNNPGVAELNISDLANIKTATGQTITQKEGVFKLKLGWQIASPLYYGLGFSSSNIKQDLSTMAKAVKASGNDTINVNVTFGNKALAEERAKQAYEACLKEGFPPEKINLTVNGEKYDQKKLEELFGKGQLEQLHQETEQNRQLEERAINRIIGENPTTNFKTTLTDMKKTQEASKAPAPEVEEPTRTASM